MREESVKVGNIYETCFGEQYEVIERKNNKNIIVRFLDGSNCLYRIQKKDIQVGKTKHPYRKTVFGLGYLGDIGSNLHPEYLSNFKMKLYNIWYGVMERCYCPKFKQKMDCYEGCFVNEKWHNFTNFYTWAKDKYVEGYDLDKDILVQGNREYSEIYCRFIPDRINKLVLRMPQKSDMPHGVDKRSANCYVARISTKEGRKILGYGSTKEEAYEIYKQGKQEYIKTVANEYKDVLDKEIYESLIDWNF